MATFGLIFLLSAVVLFNPVVALATTCPDPVPARPSKTWVVGIDRSGSTDRFSDALEQGISDLIACNARRGDQLQLFTFGADRQGQGRAVYSGALPADLQPLLRRGRRAEDKPARATMTFFDVALGMLEQRVRAIDGLVTSVIASDGWPDKRGDIDMSQFGTRVPLGAGRRNGPALWTVSAVPLQRLGDAVQTAPPNRALSCLVRGDYQLTPRLELQPTLWGSGYRGTLTVGVDNLCDVDADRERGLRLGVFNKATEIAHSAFSGNNVVSLPLSLQRPDAPLSVRVNGRLATPVDITHLTWWTAYGTYASAAVAAAILPLLLLLALKWRRRSAPHPVAISGWRVEGGLKRGQPLPVPANWVGLPVGSAPPATVTWQPGTADAFAVTLADTVEHLTINDASPLNPARVRVGHGDCLRFKVAGKDARLVIDTPDAPEAMLDDTAGPPLDPDLADPLPVTLTDEYAAGPRTGGFSF